jgi:hypothetical protein
MSNTSNTKKKPINSKSKGNRVENELAKILSERFNRKFTRVPMSGGWGTSNRSSGVREDALEVLSGDLMAPKDFKFAIESKSRSDFNFWDFINEDTKELDIDSWLFQVENDAKATNKEPLLYIKINNRKPFVMFPKKLYEATMTYKEYSIMRFDYFLQLEDNFFFMGLSE